MAVPRGTRSGIPDTVPIIGCGTANRNAECWVVIDCTATSKVFAQTRSLSPQFVHQFPGPALTALLINLNKVWGSQVSPRDTYCGSRGSICLFWLAD